MRVAGGEARGSLQAPGLAQQALPNTRRGLQDWILLIGGGGGGEGGVVEGGGRGVPHAKEHTTWR